MGVDSALCENLVGLGCVYWIMFIPSCYLTALIWLREWLYPSLIMIVCHPFFMLPIMGFGTFERWWHSYERGDWELADIDHFRLSDYGPSGLHWDIDPLDPRSPFFGSPNHKVH
jgi:hypothetical protein